MNVRIGLLIGLIWFGGMPADHRDDDRMGRGAPAIPSPIQQAGLILEIEPSMFNGTVQAIEPVERDVMVRGTIEALDPVSLSLVIRTDFGRMVHLAVSDLEVMESLARGDRIRFEVDEQGRPTKIQKLQRDNTGLDRRLAPDGSRPDAWGRGGGARRSTYE